MMLHTPQPDWTLIVITNRHQARGRSELELVRAALLGGATAVQLRCKDAGWPEMAELGQTLMAGTREAGVPLIVNDRVDLAVAIGAEGAHVGQADLSAPEARRMLGSRILGVSATNLMQALQGEDDGADYIGVGPIFATPSKHDAAQPIGLQSLAQIVRRVRVPVVAIGGITSENVGEVIRAGASGVAVIGAIMGADDPEHAARQLRSRIDEARSAQG